MLEPGDLFLSFMRGPELADDALPRLGVWRAGDRMPPNLAPLSDSGRDWIAALGLPEVFRRAEGAAPRSDAAVHAGMANPVRAEGRELDDRMHENAERHGRASGMGARRTRAKDNVVAATDSAGHSIEPHLGRRAQAQGQWVLEGVRTDVDLLLAAARDERWADARRILQVVASPNWDGPAADIDIAGVQIPSDHVSDPTARSMLEAAITRAARPPRPEPAGGRKLPGARVLVGVAIAAAAAIGLVLALAGGGNGAGLSQHLRELRANGKVLIVSNLVTSGAHHMTEDRYPAVLTGRPVPICCTVKGSQRRSSDRYDAAVCQVIGPYDTNGNDMSTADDHNPGLAKSHLYYGVVLADGRFGFTSDIWVQKSQRGGLGLPPCDGNRPPR